MYKDIYGESAADIHMTCASPLDLFFSGSAEIDPQILKPLID
jgi:hypothetical protein